MTDPLTDSILTEDRERSAPGMSHADTETPLHGPTGGVPSDKRQGTLRHAGRCWCAGAGRTST
eukprot:scaffold18906_cov122-Isochrysis_galbana.AAC.2